MRENLNLFKKGVFDGQFMVDETGKKHFVSPNYASKSHLIEGDKLNMYITDKGNVIVKQIEPAQRKNTLGIVIKSEPYSCLVSSENRIFQVLGASRTYYKLENDDIVSIVYPARNPATWCSVLQVIRRSNEDNN